MTTIDKILTERASKYGEFLENSRATWEIMRALQNERNWPTLSDGDKHALYMIAHKMARILAGDPGEVDHWDDISGYARCVVDRIRQPVIAYDGDNVVAALARGWNVSIPEAKKRMATISANQRGSNGEGRRTLTGTAGAGTSAEPPKLPGGLPSRRSADENYRPGTPEDGGHYAAESEENLAEELRRGFERGH